MLVEAPLPQAAAAARRVQLNEQVVCVFFFRAYVTPSRA